MNADGSGRTKALPHPILELHAISPDGRWAVVVDSQPQGTAESLDGGPPMTICPGYCDAGWSRDGRKFVVFVTLMDETTSVIASLSPGKDLPGLPPGGVNEANLDHVKDAKVTRAWSIPGPGAISAFLREEVHRNLFRVPLQ
jgi:hypothetical protein